MKKILYFIISIPIILLVIIYLGKNNNLVLENTISQKDNSNSISMMYETDAGSGIYEVSSDNSWPTSGYKFNETLSKCENGSKLTWNDATKTVVFSGNISDKCYVYFDVYLAPSVSSIVASNITTSSFRITLTATEGDNAIGKYYFSIDGTTWYESTNNYYDFSNLSISTTYTLYGYAVDTTGVSSTVITGSATTLSGTSPTITRVDVSPGGKCVTFSISAEEGSSSISNYYYAVVSSDEACPSIGSSSYIIGSSSFTVNSLTPLTSYNFCTYVTDQDGMNSDISITSFSTLSSMDVCK